MAAKSMGDQGRPRILVLDLDGTLLSYEMASQQGWPTAS
jgi:hypothetical protein